MELALSPKRALGSHSTTDCSCTCHSSGSHGVLLQLAGTHVRNAATVGGNLALSRERGLESDLATVLMGAGATTTLVELESCADARKARCVLLSTIVVHSTVMQHTGHTL